LVEIPKEQADYFRGHIPEFLGSARSSLRFDEGGAMIGFQILDVEPGGPVGRLGIRDGDVILGVNGVRLDGMAKLLALYPSLASLASVDVMLQRAGRLLTVGYRVK
jgi:S1-C subfamily serine protease